MLQMAKEGDQWDNTNEGKAQTPSCVAAPSAGGRGRARGRELLAKTLWWAKNYNNKVKKKRDQ